MEILEGREVFGVGPPLRWPPAACSSEPTACGVLAVRSEVIDDEMVRNGNRDWSISKEIQWSGVRVEGQ